ncbi:heterokaryon incompatibility protein-domain-containing protein [Leptodontidium sp. MPI-SDFR-AT-0119]|nr:heterokaryon incompatibility protein-domain-containing protein [Leptodontidium sp. MPI-SDFR-AT-0119]
MALCEKEHDCRPKPTGALPSRFLVIDTVQRCLVDGVPDQRFVALSYVWGQKMDPLKLQATQKTIESLKVPGGLPPSELPATIEDAIQVCVYLNERYLWADRLCIVQDDPENMQHQIDSMGAIFSSATLVLIAAHGDHMDFGLSGVSCRRPISQERDCLLGQYVGQGVHIEGADKRTVWHTRGWTYQEAVLARRKLFFHSKQVSYACSEYLFYEDCCRQEECRSSSRSNLGDNLPDDYELISWRGDAGSRYKALKRHLVEYSNLSLSKDHDIYNAFTGIANALYPGERDVMIWGLPRDSFDQAMLWHAGSGAFPRLPYPGVILPSWSWVTYKGSRMKFRQFQFVETLVIWYVRSMSSVEEAPLQLSTRKTDSWNSSWCMIMAIACQHGCIPGMSLSVCRDAVTPARPSQNGFWWRTERPVLKEANSPQHLDRLERPQLSMLKSGVLYTNAQTAFFDVQENHSNILIMDQHDHPIGFLGDSWACGEQSTTDISIYQGKRESKYEFAGISLSMLSRHDSGLKCVIAITEDVLQELMFCEKDSTTSESGCSWNSAHPIYKNYKMGNSVPIVNVLLIAWRGRYARRVQLGWILLAHWIKAERELKDLYIE